MADEVKLGAKVEKIAKEIEGLSVLEVSELAQHLEEKFGVTAIAMPAAAAPTVGATGAAQAADEEKTNFTVVLAAAGDNKLGVIKAVRELNQSLGLMEAKKLVESTPQELLKDLRKEPAEEAKKKLEAAGAKVELK